jgi:hypothetical protein
VAPGSEILKLWDHGNLQPEPWNFRLFASLEPALDLKLYLKLKKLGLSKYGSLGPWNLGTRKLGVLDV